MGLLIIVYSVVGAVVAECMGGCLMVFGRIFLDASRSSLLDTRRHTLRHRASNSRTLNNTTDTRKIP